MRITRSELEMVTACPRGVYFYDFTEPVEKFLNCKRYWSAELVGFDREKVAYQLLDELKNLIVNHSWFYWQNVEAGKFSFSFSTNFMRKFDKLKSDIKATKYAQHFFDFIEQTNSTEDYGKRITIRKSWYSEQNCSSKKWELQTLSE